MKSILIKIDIQSPNQWIVSLFNNDPDQEHWGDEEKHEHFYKDYDSAINFVKGLKRSYQSMGLSVEIDDSFVNALK